MHLVLCNGNLMRQTSQKMKIGLFRLDIQTWFFSKHQLSGFLLSKVSLDNLVLKQDDLKPISSFFNFCSNI